jgi:hypothetical protein
MNTHVREWLLACAPAVLIFVICRSLTASWYAVDLSGIPDEGQVSTSMLPWFLYSYDLGGGVWSDSMRARTWLVSCVGYFLPAAFAMFAPRRTATRVGAAILAGGLIGWAIAAIPAPPPAAGYYTTATVLRARLWIVALSFAGAVVGVLTHRVARQRR